MKRSELAACLKLWEKDADIKHVVELGDGVSARVFGIEYKTTRGLQRAAIRIVVSPLNLCLRESLLLNRLYQQGLLVPQCFGVKSLDKDKTAMLMEWLPGKVINRPIDIPAYVEQMAVQLAQIHAASPPPNLPKAETRLRRNVQQLINTKQYDHWRKATGRNMPTSQKLVLLHGDYWPGNWLFQRKTLTGVVDWADACLGDPLYDLANTRFELRWLWGDQAADEFTQMYVGLTKLPTASLPKWDVVSLAKPILFHNRWGLSESQTRRLRETIVKVEQQSLRAL